MVYNPRTDIIHKLSQDGGMALKLCDGSQTLLDIAKEISLRKESKPDANELAKALFDYFKDLEGKELIRWVF